MIFRYARHTNNLEALTFFYTEILGFTVLGSFENHDGYKGIFIGNPHENWHLEFTQTSEVVNHTFDEDDILVFYPKDKAVYAKLLHKLEKYSVSFIQPKNSYWTKNGKMFLDSDGYRIIISDLKCN